MTFWEFIEKLSKKILTYKPTSRIYQDDENIRMSVTLISNQQKRGIPKNENDDKNTATFNTLKWARHTRHQEGRL